MLKLSLSLLQPGVYFQYPDAHSVVSQSPGAVVFLKAAILTFFSGHDYVLGPIGLGPCFFMVTAPVKYPLAS